MNKQAEIEFYKNLDPKKLNCEKAFWKTFNTLLPNKCSNSARKIDVIDEGILLSKDKEISECFNTYLVNIKDILKIERLPVTIHGPLEHPVHAAILRYTKHPSIIPIKKRANDTYKFAFQAFVHSEVWE